MMQGVPQNCVAWVWLLWGIMLQKQQFLSPAMLKSYVDIARERVLVLYSILSFSTFEECIAYFPWSPRPMHIQGLLGRRDRFVRGN